MSNYPAPPPPQVDAPTAPTQPHHRRRKWPLIVAAIVVLVVVIAVAANAGKGSTDTAGPPSPTSSAAPAQTSTPATTAAARPPATTRPAPTTLATTARPRTTAAPSPTFQPLPAKNYSGTGDDVITIDKPADKAALLTFSCPTCTSNVSVTTDSDLLVNEIGAYTGTHLIDIRKGEQTTTLEITADSDWTVDITDITTAPHSASGTGDSVIWVDTGTKAVVTHDGESNFAILEASTSNGMDLLVNEIGPYSGTVRVHSPAILDITADGAWTIAS